MSYHIGKKRRSDINSLLLLVCMLSTSCISVSIVPFIIASALLRHSKVLFRWRTAVTKSLKLETPPSPPTHIGIFDLSSTEQKSPPVGNILKPLFDTYKNYHFIEILTTKSCLPTSPTSAGAGAKGFYEILQKNGFLLHLFSSNTAVSQHELCS